jgi:inorganic pyrophosphatase
MDFIKDAYIEIPYNTSVKYEYDKQLNKMRCDRILNTSMLYPGNYGYIPNTLADDGDALDILVMCDYSLFPGTVIESKIIGVLMMEDEKGLDEKIISVPSYNVDNTSKDINTINDLNSSTLKKIAHFFTHYKDNEKDKWCKVYGFHDNRYAISLCEKYKQNI